MMVILSKPRRSCCVAPRGITVYLNASANKTTQITLKWSFYIFVFCRSLIYMTALYDTNVSTRNRPVAQIPYLTMHHFVAEMCTHFFHKMVHYHFYNKLWNSCDVISNMPKYIEDGGKFVAHLSSL